MVNDEMKFVKLNNGLNICVQPDDKDGFKRFMVLEGPTAKKYAAYHLISKDIDLVIKSLQNLKEIEYPTIIQQSLSFFSIITYSKCFVSNQGGRGTSLTSREVFKNADLDIIDEHKRIWHARMDYVAHAGDSLEKCPIVATLHFQKDIYCGFSVDVNMAYVHSISPSVEKFLGLCEFVKNFVSQKLNVFEKKIYLETAAIPEDDLYALSILPNPANLLNINEIRNNYNYSKNYNE